MTKKLREFFDLDPEQSEELKDTEAKHEEVQEEISVAQAFNQLQAMERELPAVPTDADDEDMDEYARKSIEKFDELMDLGLNTEPRFAAPIFEAATKMMGHAVTAKMGKMQKKLKQVELKLKQQKLEFDMNGKRPQEEQTVQVQAKVWDRNDLIKSFKDNENK